MNTPKKKYNQLTSIARPIVNMSAQVPLGGASRMRLFSSSDISDIGVSPVFW